MKLWQRYLLYRLTITFIFLLVSLFAIYVLFDLSIHGISFFVKNQTQIFDLLIYYVCHFSLHLDLFLPLSFLLSSLKTLLDLSTHLELVALQVAGISKKCLLFPFFAFAMVLSLIGYANHEWIEPNAGLGARTFKIAHTKWKKKRENVQSIVLQDGSQLIYQRYDRQAQEFFDLFWIRSPNDIWTLKTLSLSSSPPIGRFVDHLIRDKDGLLVKAESYEKHVFKQFAFQEEFRSHPPIPTEHRPISALFQQALLRTAEQAIAKTHLHRKLAQPLLPFAALFAIAPFSMTFSRARREFLLVSLSLFGFIMLMTLYESLVILGENQVLIPEIAMWSPLGIIFGLFSRKFWAI